MELAGRYQLMTDKRSLRKIMHEKRNSLSSHEVAKASGKIVEKLVNLPYVKESRIIMSFMPYGNEVNIIPLNEWILEQGKALCIPRVLDGTNMDAVKIDSIMTGLVKNSYGIYEPSKDLKPIEPEKIELILVPGVAFDINGNRLGHGKGYYDRFLLNRSKNAITLGIAYSFQVLDSIPHDEHDVRLDGIVTESEVILLNGR